MFYARDEGSDALWIGGHAPPCFAAVVGVVGSGVAVADSAARRTPDGTCPRSGNIVVGCGDDSVGVVAIYRDDWFVLGCSRRVLVDGNIGGLDCLAIKRARQNV